MGKNTKPMLTVLVEENKLQQLRDYALDKEVSMGWVVNKLLDRLLKGDVDVMTDTPSTAKSRESIEPSSTGLSRVDVEKMIEVSLAKSRESIESLVDKSLDKISIDTNDIQKMVNASIEVAVEPIKTYTKSQIEAVRGELAAIKKP